MAEKFRVGIVGYGAMGQAHAEIWSQISQLEISHAGKHNRGGCQMERVTRALMVLFVSVVLASCGTDKGTSAHGVDNAGAIQGRIYTIPSGDQTGVEVYLSETRFVTVSDRNGTFIITEVPEGEYELVVEKQGYSRASRKVAVTAQRNADVEVTIGKLSAIVGHVQATVFSTDRSRAGFADSIIITAATGQKTVLRQYEGVFEEFVFFVLSNLPSGSNWIMVEWDGSSSAASSWTTASSFYYIPSISPGETYAIPYTLLHPGQYASRNYIPGRAINIWGYISPANRSAIVLLWSDAGLDRLLLSGSVAIDNEGMYVVPIFNLASIFSILGRSFSTVYLEARLTYLAYGKVFELSSGLVAVDLRSYFGQPINLSLSEIK